MSTPKILPIVDHGLGNSTYLLDAGDGRALAVDPSRDLRAVDGEARRHGLEIAYVAETHLHADFVTGAAVLGRRGAQVLASAAGGRTFPHRGLRDGEEADLGGLRLRALAAPGHTEEHLAFLLLDGDRPLGVFTGGSLIVGAAARTDLVDPARTDGLARAQYASLRRLAELPDDVLVWPTHGAGSFCSAPAGGERTSTIGREKATNPLLLAASEDEFVERLLAGLGSFPAYFRRLPAINRHAPTEPPGTALRRLDVAETRALLARGAVLVDVRPAADFAAAHVPGSLSNSLRVSFATWLGWLVPPGRSLVVVRNEDQDPAEIVGQAAKVGYDDVAGELAGGVAAWTRAGGEAGSIALLQAPEVEVAEVLDVRQAAEYRDGHLPRARHLELGRLAERVHDVAPGRTVLVCRHGERAMTAASLLAAAGRHDTAVLLGGPTDWAAATGRSLVTG
jgi:glyoxylase-like metal-dependent hydrolase (beta-lactamase superfamily II)/rhodanese-related sulfurtransferase